MNDQNNFNKDIDDVFSVSDAEKNEEGIKSEGAPLDTQGHWYGVSYQGVGMSPYTPTPPVLHKKKGKWRKVAVGSLLIAACMLLSVFAGMVGTYLVQTSAEDGILPGVSGSPNSEATNGLGGEVDGPTYEYTDTAYDYAAAFAEISKNDGSLLTNSPNGSAGSAPKSMIDAIASVKDSVVEITTTVVSNRGTISAGAGSGVIIHEDGIVVTNNHVIEDCDKIYVRLTNGDTYEAALRGTDEDGDIAVLKITPQAGKPLTVAKLGSSKSLVLGEEVFAIGNPLGELGGTVTNGIISATAREISVDGVEMTLLQTNAAINSGNSGGGLFNLAGELIGVVNAKYSATGVEGLGFAIPIDIAYELSIKDLMEVGYVRGVPSLGVTLVERTGGGWGGTIYGAYVYDACGVTGFQTGDYIYSIEDTLVYGISTSALAAVKSIVRDHEVGDVLTVVLLRNNQQVTISVTLVEDIPQSASIGA